MKSRNKDLFLESTDFESSVWFILGNQMNMMLVSNAVAESK